MTQELQTKSGTAVRSVDLHHALWKHRFWVSWQEPTL